MPKIINKITKQSRPVIWLGAMRDMITRLQGYYSLFNMPLLVITAYTVRMESIQHYFPWLTFKLVLILVLIWIIGVLIADWKIIYPSQIAHHQHLAWRNISPVRKQLELMQKDIKNTKENQYVMQKALQETNNIQSELLTTLQNLIEVIKGDQCKG